MFTLDARSRGALAAGALACFVGALALPPQTARGADGASHAAVPPRVAPPHVSALAATRDPFAGGIAAERAPLAHAAAPLAFPAPPAVPPVLPPNLPAAVSGLTPQSVPQHPGARLAAVITGAHPSVVVVEGRATAIRSVGDRVDGARIRRITLDGAILDDGRVLALPGGAR